MGRMIFERRVSGGEPFSVLVSGCLFVFSVLTRDVTYVEVQHG